MSLNVEVFRYLFDKATIGIKILDPGGTIIYANNAEQELLGFEEQELLGRHFSEFIAEKERAEKFFESVKKLESIEEFNTKIIRRDQSQIDVVIDTSVNINNGELQSICCIARDVTIYKRNADLLQLLNKAGAELALTYDTKSALNKISKLIVPEFADWFSIDVVKDDKVELLKLATKNPEDLKWVQAFRAENPVTLGDEYGIGKVLKTGKVIFIPVADEIVLNRHSDQPKRDELLDKINIQSVITVPMYVKDALSGAISFIKNQNGQYYEVADLYFAQDFANRIALALENARLYEEAQAEIAQRIEAEQKKDDFISLASHELKTPLTSIKAYTQILEKKLQENTEALAFISKSAVHISYLERLISDLLDVSKINAGKLTYNLSEFNFGAALEESVESVQHLTNTHKIIIEETVNVPFKGDKHRIQQVISNILTNAIKYSPGADKVMVRAEIKSDNLVVSIRDFGIGIAKENLHKLFDRFYRVDSSSMKFSGLGLGLFIAAEILYGHNGSFWIESELNQGSTFYFRLPLEASHQTEVIRNTAFYKDNFIEVKYNKDENWIESSWNGYQTMNSVRHGGKVMMDMLIEHKCSKVLNDNSKVVGNWSESADEGREVWFPAMERAGLRHYAWIQSSSTFSQLAATKSVNSNLGSVKIKFFSNLNTAKDWLRQQFSRCK